MFLLDIIWSKILTAVICFAKQAVSTYWSISVDISALFPFECIGHLQKSSNNSSSQHLLFFWANFCEPGKLCHFKKQIPGRAQLTATDRQSGLRRSGTAAILAPITTMQCCTVKFLHRLLCRTQYCIALHIKCSCFSKLHMTFAHGWSWVGHCCTSCQSN